MPLPSHLLSAASLHSISTFHSLTSPSHPRSPPCSTDGSISLMVSVPPTWYEFLSKLQVRVGLGVAGVGGVGQRLTAKHPSAKTCELSAGLHALVWLLDDHTLSRVASCPVLGHHDQDMHSPQPASSLASTRCVAARCFSHPSCTDCGSSGQPCATAFEACCTVWAHHPRPLRVHCIM